MGSQKGFDWASAGLSALDSFGSSLSDILFGGIKARRQWKYQQKQMALQHQYNLDEMWYEQQYNEANMAKQFEYQQKAWQAENEYNDPSAVAARYRAAGVSPQAALGGSASGAGLAMSMDTPSSSNPSAHGVSGGGDYSGGSNRSQGIIAGVLAQKQIEQVDQSIEESESRARKNDAETQGILLSNAMQPLIAKGLAIDNATKEYKQAQEKFRTEWQAIDKITDLAERNARIGEIKQRINNLLADENLSKAERDNLIAQRALIEAQTSTEGARKENIESHTELTNEQSETEKRMRDARVSLTENQAKHVLTEIGLKEALTMVEYENLIKNITGTQPASSVWGYVDRLIARLDSSRGGYVNADKLRDKLYKALANYYKDNKVY